VERHVYPRTVVSVSYHYKNQSRRIGVKQQSLTISLLQTTECYCYNQDDYNNLDQSNICQIPSCPGNSYDICGVSPYAVVFEKGNIL
jgi:hypothetical protein